MDRFSPATVEQIVGVLILAAACIALIVMLWKKRHHTAPVPATTTFTTSGLITPMQSIAEPSLGSAMNVLLQRYIDRDDLMKSIGNDFPQSVILDGAVVHNGVEPAITFVTQLNSNVVETVDSPPTAEVPAPTPPVGTYDDPFPPRLPPLVGPPPLYTRPVPEQPVSSVNPSLDMQRNWDPAVKSSKGYKMQWLLDGNGNAVQPPQLIYQSPDGHTFRTESEADAYTLKK